MRFLVAAEKHAPCLLFDEEGNQLDTIWEEPGGVMTMVQVPGQENQFLATHKFYSPNDSAEAKIVIATQKKDSWEIRTLVDVPFVHRFGILSRNGINYLIVCCLKSAHEYKDDWTHPGATYAAVLPEDLSAYNEAHQLELKSIKEDMCHNHGYSKFISEDGTESGIVTCDSGVWMFTPPCSADEEWQIKQLYDEPVSDAVLLDFDHDGSLELGCISPFHGDELYICHLDNTGRYQKLWEHPEKLEMLHATYQLETSVGYKMVSYNWYSNGIG